MSRPPQQQKSSPVADGASQARNLPAGKPPDLKGEIATLLARGFLRLLAREARPRTRPPLVSAFSGRRGVLGRALLLLIALAGLTPPG